MGTYTTTLRDADLPRPVEDEFAECGLKWKMTIATSGGPDDGPVLTLFNRDEPERCGRLEGPSLRIDGDTLLLKNEECEQHGVGFLFYDNEYGWKLDGQTLTLTTVKNRCAEGSAETILTSQPWTKQ